MPRAARLLVACLALAALIAGAIDAVGEGGSEVSNYFSYFTIQSNSFASLVLIAAALTTQSTSTLDRLRGAAVLYMLLTAVISLLALDDPVGTWRLLILHLLMPLALVADWLLDPPRHRLGRPDVAVWLVYPVAFFAYTAIRGQIVDWYPYPFFDADELGHLRVLLNGVGVLAVLALLGFAVARVADWRRGAGERPEPG